MKEWRYEKETKTIRTVPGNHWIASLDSWDSMVDNEVNAAFIVRACNSHDDLLAALKQMHNLINDAEWTQHQREACLFAAQAAIAKASTPKG